MIKQRGRFVVALECSDRTGNVSTTTDGNQLFRVYFQILPILERINAAAFKLYKSKRGIKIEMDGNVVNSMTHSSLNMIPNVDNVPFLRNVLLHRSLQLLSHQFFRVVPQDVSTDSSGHLQNKHNDHQHSKGEDHAIILPDSTTASEEGDKEDNNSDGDEERGNGEKLVREKM